MKENALPREWVQERGVHQTREGPAIANAPPNINPRGETFD